MSKLKDQIHFSKIALVILDGWGIGPKDSSNPIYTTQPQNIQYIKNNFPITSLQASSIAIGLPWGEEGNSEVGHMTIGAGRIIYQDLPRINSIIEKGDFFTNPILLEIINYVKQNPEASLNLVGLISKGNVHSSLHHLKALIKIAEINKVANFNLHLITDGRDSFIKDALSIIKELPLQKIGSISGRFYAMDRDNHFSRTTEAFKAMTGDKPSQDYPLKIIEDNYNLGLTDEFIEPTPVNSEDRRIKKDDAVVFFNFRGERMRQIVKMFKEKIPSLKIATFTEYNDEFKDFKVVFPRPKIENPLSKIISDYGLTQLKIAESEKAAHITYFFNGQEELSYLNEYQIIIPSKKITSHDKYPQMMADKITERVVLAMEENIYNLIVINYANPDIIGHTGNYAAVVQAVKFIDQQIGILLKIALKTKTQLIITSDHGNAEKLIDSKTGFPETQHNISPVPFYFIDENFKKEKNEYLSDKAEKQIGGSLCDIAPTILELMNIPKPKEMTGQNLIPYLL